MTRYLSLGLYNRITFYELHRLRARLPEIVNNLPTDSLYDIENGSEPQRNVEVLQSWNSLKNLCTQLEGKRVLDAVEFCDKMLLDAAILYGKAGPLLLTPWENRSDAEHLDDLKSGLSAFRKLAEL